MNFGLIYFLSIRIAAPFYPITPFPAFPHGGRSKENLFPPGGNKKGGK